MSDTNQLYMDYWRKIDVEPLAEKKKRKMDAIWGIGVDQTKQARGVGFTTAHEASIPEEAAKATAFPRGDVNGNMQQNEASSEFLSVLWARVDEIEIMQNKMSHVCEELANQFKAEQRKNFEVSENFKLQLAVAEIAHGRFETEVMAKMEATADSADTAMRHEMAKAAKERKAVQCETDLIKENIKVMRDEFIELDLNRQSKFVCLVSRATNDISVFKNVVVEQVAEVGRYIDKTKDSIDQQLHELRALSERTTAELERQTKDELPKIQLQHEELRRDLKAKSKFLRDRLSQERTKLEGSARDEHKWMGLSLEKRKRALYEFRNQNQEGSDRSQDTDGVLS